MGCGMSGYGCDVHPVVIPHLVARLCNPEVGSSQAGRGGYYAVRITGVAGITEPRILPLGV